MAVFFLLAALLPGPVSSVLHGSRFLTGEVGGSVTSQCFYSITPANRHDRKYWCKIAGSGVCLTVVSTSGYVSRGFEGRVSLRDAPRNGTFTVRLTRLQRSDAGAYRCGIGPSNAGLFVRQRLAVSEETWSSRGPGTSTLADPTPSSAPAASSTSTQRSVTGQTYTRGGAGASTSALASLRRSATFETSRKEIYRGSASSESHLFSVVPPALVGLLLITAAVLVLTKIKLRKKAGREISAPGSVEAAPFQADLDPVKEQTMEKTMSPEKLKKSKTDAGESRITYAILGDSGRPTCL
ncbi:high affinity immunoglobulin alpha and immunoglobulin mu Fc receptor-like isoform X2 [Dromaius novaehollandiae]